jgi:hypothetical protein
MNVLYRLLQSVMTVRRLLAQVGDALRRDSARVYQETMFIESIIGTMNADA